MSVIFEDVRYIWRENICRKAIRMIVQINFVTLYVMIQR